MIPEFCISFGCPALFFLLPIISVGVVLIFQLGPGHGTEASFPVVPRYRFWHLGSGTSVLVPTSGYQGFITRFSRGYLHFSHFGTSSVTFRYHFSSKSGGT